MRFVRPLWVTAIVIVLCASAAQPAAAIQQFYNAWVAEYLDAQPDSDYAKYVKKDVKCYVCHQGKNRKHRNAYGAELAKLLDKKKDAKDKEKIAAALKQVAAMHADPNDDKSETFGDRIKLNKLPGGNLDDLKKEPAE